MNYNIRAMCNALIYIIGACFYLKGKKPPNLITRDMRKTMKSGAGNRRCWRLIKAVVYETNKGPTTHETPIYIIDEIVHYSVGEYARCSAIYIQTLH